MLLRWHHPALSPLLLPVRRGIDHQPQTLVTLAFVLAFPHKSGSFHLLAEALDVAETHARALGPSLPRREQRCCRRPCIHVALATLINPDREAVLSHEIIVGRLGDGFGRIESPLLLPVETTIDHPLQD